MSGDIDMGGGRVKNLKVIRFDDEQGVHNDILFRDTSRLSFGSYNENTYDPYIHLNDLDTQKVIELMKDIDLHGNINVKNNKRITGLQTPVGSSEPATKAYADSLANSKLSLSGGTLTGQLNMNNNILRFNPKFRFQNDSNVNMAMYCNTKFWAIKDDEVYTNLPIGMRNQKITELANGTEGTDAVNKTQLDQGLLNLDVQKLSRTGGTMTGDLNLGGNNMFNINEVNLAGNNGRFVYFTTGDGVGTNIQSAQANDTIYFSKHASIDKTLNINTSTKVSSFFGNIDINNNRISNLNGGVAPADAVNRAQLDTKLNLTGGTMTGSLNFDDEIKMRTTANKSGKIAIGMGANPSNKSNESISIGSFAGQENQGDGAVAIGSGAGYGSQGTNSIAIGKRAGYSGSNQFTSQASNSIVLNATGDFVTTGTQDSFIVKPIRNDTSNNMLFYNNSSGEITYGEPQIGETIRYINITEKGFNPSGVGHGIVCTFDPIPDGEYYFDINATVKHTQNNANADGFTFIINPSYVVSPDPVNDIDYATNLQMNNLSISSSNNTYGSKNLKWFDTRTSADNNTSITINFSYNGGGALTFDLNIRGTIKKIN